MEAQLAALRSAAETEKQRLAEEQKSLEESIEKSRKLRAKSGKLRLKAVAGIDKEILGNYERIRKRLGGTAFVAAHRERCTACKMMIPHILYMRLLKGKEILPCESCGRLLYWSGHFPEDHDKQEEAKPKPAEDVIPGVPEF
jgi:predicted  nucleic acid-binding Zn-ribbon protein